MLAGMFQKAGYFLGDKLYPPRDANPKGFFEDEEVNRLNEDIIHGHLKSLGADPHSYRPGQVWLARFPVDMKFAASDEQQAAIRDFTARSPFCFKDPRFAFTLEAWLNVEPNAVVVCIYRDPASVVASLFKECSTAQYLFSFPLSVDHALAAWREIYWRLLVLYRNHPNVFFVSYHDIVTGSAIQELQKLIDAPLDLVMPDASLDRSRSSIPLDEKTKLVIDTLSEISKGDLGQEKTPVRLSMIQQLEDKLRGTALPFLMTHGAEWEESTTTRLAELIKTTENLERNFESINAKLDIIWRGIGYPVLFVRILLSRLARAWRVISMPIKIMLPGRTAERRALLQSAYRSLPLPNHVKRRISTFLAAHFGWLRKVMSDMSIVSLGLWHDWPRTARLPPYEEWVLVAANRIPTPDRTSCSTRLDAILTLLIELGFHVAIVSQAKREQYQLVIEDDEELRKYEEALSSKGISIFYGLNESVEHLKSEGYKYRYAFLSYPEVAFQYIPLIRAYALSAEIVYDTVDLHGLRFSREAELKDDDTIREKAKHYSLLERFNIECSDLVIAITAEEKAEIQKISEDARVEIIPNIHSSFSPEIPLSDRRGLMFIGHYLHSPNEDAVKYFVKDIFPYIKKKLGKDVVFRMVGSSMTEAVKKLGSDSVQAIGYVEDPVPYFASARVFVAPLRFGAGMKGKIGQSLSLGLPIVTTTIGAEGMGLTHGENVLIADSPEEFAEAVVALYMDDTLWRRISQNGLRYIEDNFSPSAVRSTLARIFIRDADKEEEERDEHRRSKQQASLASGV